MCFFFFTDSTIKGWHKQRECKNKMHSYTLQLGIYVSFIVFVFMGLLDRKSLEGDTDDVEQVEGVPSQDRCVSNSLHVQSIQAYVPLVHECCIYCVYVLYGNICHICT